jgi:hypothetical protein
MAKPWGAVEQLLLAAGSGPEQLNATVQKIGLGPTVDVIVDELVVRCDLPPLDLVCRFQLEIVCGAEHAGRVLTIDRGGIGVESGWSDVVMARIRFDAIELVESLFAPADHRSNPQRDVTWSNVPTDQVDLNDATVAQASFERW